MKDKHSIISAVDSIESLIFDEGYSCVEDFIGDYKLVKGWRDQHRADPYLQSVVEKLQMERGK